MFKALIGAEKLKDSIESISTLVDEARFRLTPQGLSVKAVDPANVAMVSFELSKDAFESFEATEGELGIDLTKLIGVLEMAGGVAHKLNQPLTIIRNMVNEVLSDLKAGDPNYEKILRIHQQIERINELARKIVNIRKYEPMDYVAGVRIVDIDKTT